jgi:radical SAM protein with 4Fe4S-binding SPASM domain
MVDSNGVDYDGFSVFWQKIGVDNTINRKFLTYDTFREDNKADACKEREPCPYPFQRINILADGNVTFCNYDVRQNYFMGNANNRSIHDIWHSEEYNKWRELVFKGHYEEIPLCSGCEDWKHKSWTHNIFKVIKESK